MAKSCLILFVQIKFYWNRDTLTCLCIISGCSHSATAELSTHYRKHTGHKASNTYYLSLHRSLLTRALGYVFLCNILKFNDVWSRSLFLEIQKQSGSFRKQSHLENSHQLFCWVILSSRISFPVVVPTGQTTPFRRRLIMSQTTWREEVRIRTSISRPRGTSQGHGATTCHKTW